MRRRRVRRVGGVAPEKVKVVRSAQSCPAHLRFLAGEPVRQDLSFALRVRTEENTVINEGRKEGSKEGGREGTGRLWPGLSKWTERQAD